MLITNYSTEEKIVGKWFNGKPLYQKTIVKSGNQLENEVPQGGDVNYCATGVVNGENAHIVDAMLKTNCIAGSDWPAEYQTPWNISMTYFMEKETTTNDPNLFWVIDDGSYVFLTIESIYLILKQYQPFFIKSDVFDWDDTPIVYITIQYTKTTDT